MLGNMVSPFVFKCKQQKHGKNTGNQPPPDEMMILIIIIVIVTIDFIYEFYKNCLLHSSEVRIDKVALYISQGHSFIPCYLC